MSDQRVASDIGDRSIRPRLHRSIAGAVAGPVVDFDLRRLYLHNLSLIGSSMHTRDHFATLLGAVRSGAAQPVIAARYALPDLAAAQEQFMHTRHVGKIVITVE